MPIFRVDLKWQPPLEDGGAPVTNYIVECKERFKNEWVKCHVTEKPNTSAVVTDVIEEGKTYEFRVRAVNKAGPGKASEPTKQVTVESRFVKPFIVGDKMRDLVIKCGQILTWDVKFGGEPEPEAKWFCGDKEITPDDR